MARRCGAMAAGIRGRLSLVCPSRWLQGWHLSLGPSGARLAHAETAAQLQREYDAVVIGAGNRAREQESSCGEQAGTHICPPLSAGSRAAARWVPL